MKKLWILIKREYMESVFKKSFIFITLLTPLIMIALGVIPSLLIGLESEEPVVLNVVDKTGFIFTRLNSALSDTLSNGSKKYFLNLKSDAENPEYSISNEKIMVETGVVDGFLFIPEDITESSELSFYSKNVANFDLNRRIENTVTEIVVNKRLAASQLDPELINKLTKSINLKTYKITKGGEESERGFGEEYFSTFIFVLILYATLILYGTSIMRSIVQEKSSRIIEVLLSSASPFQMMAGKILGQGSVGLTQYLIWAVFGIGMIFFGGRVMPISSDYFNFSPMLFVYFVLFYILGYFIFSILYAAVGALTNTDQEAQQLSFPIVFLLIIPIMLLGFLVKNPDSNIAVVLSLIPFFSPIIMFARINLSSPSFLEIGGSIVILIITIIFLIWVVSKIYRVGILMYGKRPTLPEIMRWMRY
ncbi:MAG: ABC transporter permease [Calditrichaceae bacterium]